MPNFAPVWTDLEGLVVADAAADGGRGEHDLERGDSAVHLAVRVELRQEDLGDDGLESHGELRAHLLLLVGWEGVHDTVDRLGRAGGVERTEHQVARFGGGDGRADRLEVAHFAHEDHVGVLAEGAADGLGEARHVRADFALGDERLARGVVEFDRVLDRDDVHAALAVDDVDHRGEGGGLAGTRRAGHEDEAARLEEELLHRLGKADLLKCEQGGGDHAEHAAPALAFLEHGDAEARAVLVGEREVGAAVLLDLGDLLGGHHLVAELVRVLLRERLVGDGHELAVDAEFGRHERAHVQVARAFVDCRLQQILHRDFSCHFSLSFS